LELKVVEKDVTRPKLTITTDRREIKFPPGTPQEIRDRLLAFAKRINDEVKEVTYSQRGTFKVMDDGNYTITLAVAAGGQRKCIKSFYEVDKKAQKPVGGDPP